MIVAIACTLSICLAGALICIADLYPVYAEIFEATGGAVLLTTLSLLGFSLVCLGA
jgi:hypothetical protein